MHSTTSDSKEKAVVDVVSEQVDEGFVEQEKHVQTMAPVVTACNVLEEEDEEPAVCRFQVLSYEQVKRLHSVMEEEVPVHGRGNFPTLDIKLKDLVRVVRQNLKQAGIQVRDIRLNGGAASHILAGERANGEPVRYNDLDLIFGVRLASARRDLELVKRAVLESLLDFLPEGVSKERMSSPSLRDGYVHKMVKVVQTERRPFGDIWSLISLKNNHGRHVELKFVDTMKRQFEFSVDSFQIILDSLLLFYDCAEMPMSEHFYPTVVGESVFGDFSEALDHLHDKIIATRNPEEIRGGGLLKYVHLLVLGYQPLVGQDTATLERYMCSRFFIDFGDICQQQAKLEKYLTNHFDAADADDHSCKYDFLMMLYRVVNESTVCLMGHERTQTLYLIDQLAYREYLLDQQHYFSHLHQQHPPDLHSQTSSSSSSSSCDQWSESSGVSMSSSASTVSSCPSPCPSDGGYTPPMAMYSNYYHHHSSMSPSLPHPPYHPCQCAPCSGWVPG